MDDNRLILYLKNDIMISPVIYISEAVKQESSIVQSTPNTGLIQLSSVMNHIIYCTAEGITVICMWLNVFIHIIIRPPGWRGVHATSWLEQSRQLGEVPPGSNTLLYHWNITAIDPLKSSWISSIKYIYIGRACWCLISPAEPLFLHYI